MSIEQKLKMALAYSGTSQAELARRIGTTWRAEFVFDDGTVI